jgi:hypothetical protein
MLTPIETDAEKRAWAEPWRVRLREADMIKLSLQDRVRAQDKAEADAAVTLAQEKALAAPATAAEAAILESKRINGHIDALIGTAAEPLEISSADFAAAFSKHYDGWKDGRGTIDHLRDYRLSLGQPAVAIVEDEPEPDQNGLRAILARGARK